MTVREWFRGQRDLNFAIDVDMALTDQSGAGHIIRWRKVALITDLDTWTQWQERQLRRLRYWEGITE